MDGQCPKVVPIAEPAREEDRRKVDGPWDQIRYCTLISFALRNFAAPEAGPLSFSDQQSLAALQKTP
jgi:hypothetical protein